MKNSPREIRLSTLKQWFKPYTQGPMMLQFGLYWIILVVLVMFVINYPAGMSVGRFYGTVLSLTTLLILNIAWINPRQGASPRQHAVHDWAFLILSAALVLTTAWLSGQGDVAYLLTMVCAQASLKRGVWPAGVIFGAANLLIWLGYQVVVRTPLTLILAVESALATGVISVLVLMTLLTRYARQTQRAEALLQELQAANAQLEAAHRQEKNLAIAEERLRLARDIHDGLGHHLTVLSIQLQAADKLAERNPQAAAQAIRICRAEAQAALEEVRHSVSVMRQLPAGNHPLPEALSALVQDFGRLADIPALFTCTGEPAELSLSARETIYRVAQEGLTNVRKHAAHAQRVSVCLAYESQAVRLRIEDDAPGPAAGDASHSPGFGLEGLRERAAQLGGTFRSGPRRSQGFEIEICIPASQP